jgi:hypothetical protein
MKTRIVALTVVLLLCGRALPAEPVAKKGVTPVEAELIADLNARALKAGSTVFARVTADWSDRDCTLNNGAILEGHVVSVVPHSKTVKISELDLAFTRAQCGQPKLGAFELQLAAIAAPPENPFLSIGMDDLPIQQGPAGQGIIQTALAAGDPTETGARLQLPRMKVGEVAGIKGLKLSVGTGPENSTDLTLDGHDVSLEKHTILLLVPARERLLRVAASAGVSSGVPGPPSANNAPEGVSASGSEEAASAPPEPTVEDIDVCAPPECNIALPSASSIGLGKTEATISIRQLGYASRPQRIVGSFDDDDALAWLGPRQLLVAFNPHILAVRHSLGPAGWTERIIRGALVDTKTHHVIRSVDWELPDFGKYLWPLADGRVLVHVGSELRVYGENLKIERRFPLDGPLAFIRVTPDGAFTAVGIVHERHSPELHEELVRNLGAEPEEDVSILVLNRNFETIATSNARPRLMPPTLLNEGQVRMLAQPDMRYRIAIRGWDGRTSTIAQLKSSCVPELSSIAPDLLFLVSCDKQTEGRQYRVLRPNGKVELKGDSTLNECGDAALGNDNGGEFVVKLVQSSLPVPPGALFSAENFDSETLGVYRAYDGKRLLSVRVTSPTSSRDGYALAPDGSQLAVLTRDEVAFYAVPAK